MNFNEMVSAAQARAQSDAAVDQVVRAARLQTQADRIGALNKRLRSMTQEIEAIPATLVLAERMATIRVQRTGGSMRLKVWFETDVWSMYFISCEVHTTHSLEESSCKAATVDEAIPAIAELIGRYLGAARYDPSRRGS